jgi:uncharacterized membrane protein
MNRTRLLLLALIASFGLNLFFIGGIAYRINRAVEFSGRPLPPNVSWMVRDLSEARRAELQPLMERSEEEIRSIRLEMFDAQRRLNELMTTQDYSAANLTQAFAELRSANLRYQEMSHQHSVAMLNELTAAERQLAVEFIDRRGPREGRDRRGFGGPPGDRMPPPNFLQ